MLQKAEAIYHKANELVRRCGTRDTLRIASEIGIYIHQIGIYLLNPHQDLIYQGFPTIQCSSLM